MTGLCLRPSYFCKDSGHISHQFCVTVIINMVFVYDLVKQVPSRDIMYIDEAIMESETHR